jgi:pyruvate formate lyase activating enzyme
MPIINGLNNDKKTIQKTIQFIKKLPNKKNIKSIEILPYHKLGVSKYEQLGIKYPLDHYKKDNITLDSNINDLKKLKNYLESELKEFNITVKLILH